MKKPRWFSLTLGLLLFLLVLPANAFGASYFVGGKQAISNLIAVKADIEGDDFNAGHPFLNTNPAFSAPWVMLVNSAKTRFGQCGWAKQISAQTNNQTWLNGFCGWIGDDGYYYEVRWDAPGSFGSNNYAVRWHETNKKYYFYMNGSLYWTTGQLSTANQPAEAQCLGEVGIDSQPQMPGETSNYVFFKNVYLDIKLGYWSLANLQQREGTLSNHKLYWVSSSEFGIYDSRY